MKITKFGHCCLLIEENGVRILTDPGSYTEEDQKKITLLDAVFITHEHTDHLHIDSLKILLKNNSTAEIYTNNAVSEILKKEGIQSNLLIHGQKINIRGMEIEGCGEQHAIMHETLTPVANTGYFFNNKFFYPGDAFYNPQKEVEILALPVAGPWCKISESINYALELKPKKSFPIHEAMLKSAGSAHRLPLQILPKNSIEFVIPELGKEIEF